LLIFPHLEEYLLNGGFVVSLDAKLINYGNTKIFYSGSSSKLETVNITKTMRKPLIVEVIDWL